MSHVYFSGSYGTLTVDRESGMVAAYDPEGNPPEYADIRRVDPMTIGRLLSDTDDILVAGFWTDEGAYCEGMLPVFATHRWRERGTGNWRETFDSTDWAPVELLPAPARGLAA
jgi:hypothetical protein